MADDKIILSDMQRAKIKVALLLIDKFATAIDLIGPYYPYKQVLTESEFDELSKISQYLKALSEKLKARANQIKYVR